MRDETGVDVGDPARRRVLMLGGVVVAGAGMRRLVPSLHATAFESAPTVTGPITGGARGVPFGSPPAEDVARRGYVMEEFLLAGTAHAYEAVPGTVAGRDGRWTVRVADERPYVTRFYVVRPADPARFNGVVVVHWQNVTGGVDLGTPFGSGTVSDEISRGYAWVGVTAQQIGITGVSADRGVPGLPSKTLGLPGWDPGRYGALQHPGDAFSYEIFSQAGRVLRSRPAGGVDPLGGLRPRTLLATGGSQSATRLVSYLNAAHPRDRVYDGFLLLYHWGLHQPLVEQDHFEMFAPAGDGRYVGTCAVRDDQDVPVLVQSGECEHSTWYPARQPDSATYRHWEIAAVPHAPPRAAGPIATSTAGAVLGAQVVSPAEVTAGLMPNPIEWSYVLNAALRRLARWVETKEPPASLPRIESEGGTIGRDPLGNALGGIRPPELDAPVASYRGRNDAAPTQRSGAAGMGTILGTATPLAADVIAAMYPTREAYLARWDASVDRLLASGVLLPEDAPALRARGRTVVLPVA